MYSHKFNIGDIVVAKNKNWKINGLLNRFKIVEIDESYYHLVHVDIEFNFYGSYYTNGVSFWSFNMKNTSVIKTVVAIKTIYRITTGKCYKIDWENIDNYRVIVDDTGRGMWYPRCYFKTLCELRKEKLNKLHEESNSN